MGFVIFSTQNYHIFVGKSLIVPNGNLFDYRFEFVTMPRSPLVSKMPEFHGNNYIVVLFIAWAIVSNDINYARKYSQCIKSNSKQVSCINYCNAVVSTFNGT